MFVVTLPELIETGLLLSECRSVNAGGLAVSCLSVRCIRSCRPLAHVGNGTATSLCGAVANVGQRNLGEFYSTAFRKTLYTSLEQLQLDLDAWLEEYNDQRPHAGKDCFGKTPMQCFLDSRQLAWDKILDQITPATNAIAS